MSMNANQATELKRPFGADRPFPQRCPRCAKKEVALTQIPYDAQIRHDGRLYKFAVPNLDIPVCRACGEKVFSEQVDDQLNAALRLHLRLLTPAGMRSALERIGMTQRDAAHRLGVAEETLSRWLTGAQIQSRAMDNLLRVFYVPASPQGAASRLAGSSARDRKRRGVNPRCPEVCFIKFDQVTP